MEDFGGFATKEALMDDDYGKSIFLYQYKKEFMSTSQFHFFI